MTPTLVQHTKDCYFWIALRSTTANEFYDCNKKKLFSSRNFLLSSSDFDSYSLWHTKHKQTRIYLCFVVSIETNNIIRYVIQSFSSWAKIFLVHLSIHSVMQNDIHIILLPYEKLSGVSIRFTFQQRWHVFEWIDLS